jgi:formate hydrogenlyase transcriptional activator
VLRDAVGAVNAELEFAGVLKGISDSLAGWVEVDAIVVTVVEGEVYRFQGLHVKGMEAVAGESFHETAARAMGMEVGMVRKLIPQTLAVRGSAMEVMRQTLEPQVCRDLEAEKRFPEDETLLRSGVRSFVRCPLVVRGQVVGAVKYHRRVASVFEPEVVEMLRELSAVVSTAVANALAYAEIRRLKEKAEAENVVLRGELGFGEIVGQSAALRRCLEAVEQVAKTDATVLIEGETGTGKELLARAIHLRSGRAAGPLIKVNCAALPAGLIASELFGHEKGAFTGALQRKLGRFELAQRGTLFLDEVGELPAEVQVALLRVLQEKEFERVGGSQTIGVDVRIIAATHRRLEQEVREGRFREDLYYRLNVFPVRNPALRERREDIAMLAEHFAKLAGQRQGKVVKGIAPESVKRMENYAWPGNIRELQNVVERAVILSSGGMLEVELGSAGTRAAREVEAIEGALRESRGKVAGKDGAAARLGVPASTLESRIRALGIDKFAFKRVVSS